MTVLTPGENKEDTAPHFEGGDPPDEIAGWKLRQGISSKYTATLKRRLGEGKGFTWMGDYKDGSEPSMERIATECGPGEYKLIFYWREEDPDGKKKGRVDDIEFSIAEEPWGRIHARWRADETRKQARQAQDNLAQAEAEAKLRAAETGTSAGGGDGLDALRRAAGTLRDLGVPIGGNVAQPSQDWSKYIPFALEYMRMQQAQRDDTMRMMMNASENSMKMMMAVIMAGKQDGGQMGMMQQIFGLGVDMLKQAATVRELNAPEKEDGVLDRVFQVIDRFGPMIIQMAKSTPQQRAADPLFGMAKASPDLQAIAKDRALAVKMVQKLDETYGFQVANEILAPLSDLGISRPAELAGNFSKWPSDGFGPDGEKRGATPATEPVAPAAAQPAP